MLDLVSELELGSEWRWAGKQAWWAQIPTLGELCSPGSLPAEASEIVLNH